MHNLDTDPSLSAVYRVCAEEALDTILNEAPTFSEDSGMALLGHIAATKFHLGDPEMAREILEAPLLQGDTDKHFWALRHLVAEGDEASIPNARAALAESSENLYFIDDVVGFDTGGIRSAEKLVGLASAGDSMLMPSARKAANNVYMKQRSNLLSILYRSGDQESLDLALQAIEDARTVDKDATERSKEEARARGNTDYQYTTYTENSKWSGMNVDEMFNYALKHGKEEDVRKVLDHYDADKRYDRLLNMYAAGIADVYDEIMATTQDDLQGLNATTIALAQGGEPRSQDIVRDLVSKQEKNLLKGELASSKGHKQRAWDKRTRQAASRHNLYKGLSALYTIGDESIEERVLSCIANDDEFRASDLAIFDDAGMDTTELYRLVYNRSSDGFRNIAIFTTGFSKELFKAKLEEGIQRIRDDEYDAVNDLGGFVVHTARLSKTG